MTAPVHATELPLFSVLLQLIVMIALVIMAVGTTVMTGPLLQRLLPRMGHAITERVAA